LHLFKPLLSLPFLLLDHSSSGGLGREIAVRLYAQGFNLILTSRNASALELLRQELVASTGGVTVEPLPQLPTNGKVIATDSPSVDQQLALSTKKGLERMSKSSSPSTPQTSSGKRHIVTPRGATSGLPRAREKAVEERGRDVTAEKKQVTQQTAITVTVRGVGEEVLSESSPPSSEPVIIVPCDMTTRDFIPTLNATLAQHQVLDKVINAGNVGLHRLYFISLWVWR